MHDRTAGREVVGGRPRRRRDDQAVGTIGAEAFSAVESLEIEDAGGTVVLLDAKGTEIGADGKAATEEASN